MLTVSQRVSAAVPSTAAFIATRKRAGLAPVWVVASILNQVSGEELLLLDDVVLDGASQRRVVNPVCTADEVRQENRAGLCSP